LPSTAISAIPPAAAVPLSSAVGPAQKRGSAASSPTEASVMPSVSRSGDWAYAVISVPAAPVTISAASPPPLREARIIAAVANPNGIAASTPTWKSV